MQGVSADRNPERPLPCFPRGALMLGASFGKVENPDYRLVVDFAPGMCLMASTPETMVHGPAFSR